jgi:hypothetical protein
MSSDARKQVWMELLTHIPETRKELEIVKRLLYISNVMNPEHTTEHVALINRIDDALSELENKVHLKLFEDLQ